MLALKNIFILLCLLVITSSQLQAQEMLFDTTKALEPQLALYLNSINRHPADNVCKKLFSDQYDVFESDKGIVSDESIKATMSFYQALKDTSIHNSYMLRLLYEYYYLVRYPKNALIIIRALRNEYKTLYAEEQPLLLLFEGESLINDGQKQAAHQHFTMFRNQFPKSITALCYIFETSENADEREKLWQLMQTTRPNHWIVKMERKD